MCRRLESPRHRTNDVARTVSTRLVAFIFCACAPCWAQAPSPGALTSLEAPGGSAAITDLGVPPTLERASIPRVLAQRLFDPSPAIRPTELTLAAAQAKLDLAVQVEAAARAAGSGGRILLQDIKTRQARTNVEAAMAAIGAKLRERRKQYSVTLEPGRRERDTQAALKAMGFDVADAVARLNKGEAVTIAVPAVGLPLPLTPATWSQHVFERPVAPRALFAELLRTPTALLFWRGLLALDDPTRRFLEASPELIATLSHEAAPIFAAYSGRVQVRDGRVQIAGDDAVRVLWETLVDEPVTRPDRFVRRLFTRDGGRLAVFFDLVQRLPEPQRAFATGLWMRRPDDRADRFRHLYDAVRAVDPDWTPALAPFKRAPDDPWLLLRGLPVAPTAAGNGLAGPQQRRFWQRAFDGGLPDNPANALHDIDDDGLVDAAWLVEQVCQQPLLERAARFRQVMTMTRAFPAPAAADLPGALMAARGVSRFYALFSALDRHGLLTPAIAIAAAKQADAVDRVGDRGRRALALASLQGGVAIVDRAVATGAIPTDTARSLIASLMSLPLRADSYGDAVARWLVERVIPVIEASADATPARRVIRALSMAAPPSPPVEWEGERYTVDWAGMEERRVEAVRQAQGGVQVDDLVTLVRVIRQLESANGAPEAMRDAAKALAALATSADGKTPLSEIAEPLDAGKLLTQASRDLARVRGPRDQDRVDEAVERLGRVADWMTSHLLVALAYTPHVGDANGAAARTGSLAFRHRFGVNEASELSRRVDPWKPPTQVDGGGAVTGALVGLDIALARVSLRRLSNAVPHPTGLSTANVEALAAQAVLANPRTMATAAAPRLSAALARSRELVRGASDDATALDELGARARISGERRTLLAWMSTNEPDRVAAMFTLAELATLGGLESAAPDAFGTPSAPFNTRWGLAWPDTSGHEPYAGRPTTGMMPASSPDLMLRVLARLEEAGLPATLAPAVLSYAVQDLLDTTTVASSDDWLGLTRAAGALSKERFDDIVSALAGIGLLAPAAGGVE